MGARARVFFLSIALPSARTGKWFRELTRGMARAARHFELTLAGGDTARSNDAISLSITVLGEVRRGRAVLRSGASVGDAIFVTGELGAAELGLALTLNPGTVVQRRDSDVRRIVAAHNYPEPCLALGEWLASKRLPSAMMDVSDGLSTDLARICKASGVGAIVQEADLPTVKVPRVLQGRGFDARALALHGGEDYGLLFTVPRRKAAGIPAAYKGTRITRIGNIVRARVVMLASLEGPTRPLKPGGWDHFRTGARKSRKAR
jgi:thiamine-monophosphate kinase